MLADAIRRSGGLPKHRLIVVGDVARIITSQNGVLWNPISSPPGSVVIRDIRWSKEQKQYVLVGNGGLIATSLDGFTWVIRTTPTNHHQYGIAYSPSLNLWVSVGEHQTIMTSTNAVTWTLVNGPSGPNDFLWSVAWSPNLARFVIVGHTPAPSAFVWSSASGSAWFNRTIPSGILWLNDVAWAGPSSSLFVAVGYNGTVITSPDVINWTLRTTPTTEHLRGVAWSDANQYVLAVGDNGLIIAGTGGLAGWTLRTTPTTQQLRGVFCWEDENNMWVVVGVNGLVMTTGLSTGTSWTIRSTGVSQQLEKIAAHKV